MYNTSVRFYILSIILSKLLLSILEHTQVHSWHACNLRVANTACRGTWSLNTLTETPVTIISTNTYMHARQILVAISSTLTLTTQTAKGKWLESAWPWSRGGTTDAECYTFIASKQWLTSDRYWIRAASSVRGKPAVALYTSGTSIPDAIWSTRERN